MLKDIWIAYKDACLQNPEWLLKCYLGVCFITGGVTATTLHFKHKADILKDICEEQRTIIELQNQVTKRRQG